MTCETIKATSRWIDLPHPILSPDLKQLFDHLLEIIHTQLGGGETEKEWRAALELLPVVSCVLSNEDAGLAKVSFLTYEFPSLDTDRFVHELFDRFVLSKCQCTEILAKSYSFEMKMRDMPRLYVVDYLILLSEKQSFERFKEKVLALKEQFQLALLNKNYSFRLALTHQALLDRKVTAIHREMIRYVQEKGEEIDAPFLLEMDRWLVSFPSEFLEKRSSLLLSKALFALINIRRELEWKETNDPSKRHVQLAFFPSQLNFTFGTKPILGCVLGIGLTPGSERFTEKHLAAALKSVLPASDLTISPQYRLGESSIQTLYVEFEKQDGMRFSEEELERLEKQLPGEIEGRIQRFVPELFMIRNEEEIMKNILILTQEIRNAQDYPQVMVRYEQHDEESLVFCIILVRLLTDESPSIPDAFSQLDHSFVLIPERTQIVNYLSDKRPIEANVFRIQLSDLSPFMRRNFSFNFFDARHHITTMIEEAVGEIRDFNGGMILKQAENLKRFKAAFPSLVIDHPELLEKFFYSLNPIEIQATIETETLKHFFEAFLSLLDAEEEDFFSYRFSQPGEQLFLFTKCSDHTFKVDFEQDLEEKGLKKLLTLSSSLLHHSFRYEGMIFDNHPSTRDAIEEVLKDYLKHRVKPKVLTLNLESHVSLDPRTGGDHLSSMVIKMLFDGLMRLNENGVPECACAEKVTTSEDQTRYIFTLRDCYWSNGMKVLAEDFEYSWKKVLSPGFNTRFAYLFYPIKNAELAKKGECSVDEVGIKALDEHTLQVDLETPTPYFLESTTLALYSPVNSYIDRVHPNWAQERNDRYICNGPFRLREKRSFYAYEMERNPFFWNSNQIKLDHILIPRVNRRRALELYNAKKLDWLGPPLSSLKESFFKQGEKVHHLPTTKSLWYFFNSQLFPFTNHKIREAFSLAVDRSRMIGDNTEHMLPAYSHLPLNHVKLFKNHQGLKEDHQKAYQIFKEGLEELGLTEEEFPQVTIIHYNSETSNRCSFILKQQWEEVLGISCRIEPYEFSDLFERLGQGDFQISCFCWISWINDPIYTLNIFRNQEEKLNFFFWENREYQKLLDRADHELNPEKRLEYLHEAEKIFSKQHLILPIFYEYERYLKRDNFHVPVINNLGLVDYAYGSFEKG